MKAKTYHCHITSIIPKGINWGTKSKYKKILNLHKLKSYQTFVINCIFGGSKGYPSADNKIFITFTCKIFHFKIIILFIHTQKLFLKPHISLYIFLIRKITKQLTTHTKLLALSTSKIPNNPQKIHRIETLNPSKLCEKKRESTWQLDVDTEKATFVRGADGAGDGAGKVRKAGAVEFNVDAGEALVPRAFRQFFLDSPYV